MPFDPSRRLRVAEQMDADDVDPRELARALRFIRNINRLLGYGRGEARAVNDALRETGGTSVLDVATGSGDLLARIESTIFRVGVDRYAATLAEARRRERSIAFVRADALALPFPDASFDVVVSTMFLHHLDDASAVAVLRELARVARRRVIVADLLRDVRAHRWITLFTLFASPMVKHDARASVAHAFTLDELRAFAMRAGWKNFEARETFGYRGVITLTKSG